MYKKGDLWVVEDGKNIYGVYDNWDKLCNDFGEFFHIVIKIPKNTKGKWSIP